MADVRINALSTTATSAASDDYLALDGSANGTRKILATNIAQNVTDVTFGTSGPSAKSSIAARAARQGLVFDGTAGAACTLGSAIGTSDATIAAFIDVPSSNPSAIRTIAYIATGAAWKPNDCVFYIETNGTLNFQLRGTLVGDTRIATVTENLVSSYGGKRVLVTATRVGTTLTIFINGVSAAFTVAGSAITWANSIDGTILRVGDLSGNSLPFVGFIAPYIENRALTAAEVVSLYEAGVPSGSDYNSASNTLLNTSTALNTFSTSFTTFTGASATGFTGSDTTASKTIRVQFPLSGALVSGRRYRIKGTATLTAMGTVQLYQSDAAYTGLGSIGSLAAGSFEFTFTAVSAVSSIMLICPTDGTAGTHTLVISGFAVDTPGLLLAPDAAQAGGGLTWYDTSGNAANITLPASGVTWNVPTSAKTASGWTYASSTETALTLTSGSTVSSNRVLRLLTTGTNVTNSGLSLESSSSDTASRNWAIATNNAAYGDLVILQSNAAGGNALTAGSNAFYLSPSRNLLLGTFTDSGNGKLQLATHTTSAGGIGFGTDTSFNRIAAGKLALTDSGSTPTLSLYASSTERVRIEASGASAYISTVDASASLYLRSGNLTTALTLDSSQNATFAGTISTATNAAKNAIVARYNSANSLFGVTVNSAGQSVLSENTDASTGSDKYSKTGLPAFRLGNTGGSGTVPFWVDVAASGTSGNAITWTNALQIDGNTDALFARNIWAGGYSTSFRMSAWVASGANRDIFSAAISGASNGFSIKWNHSTTTLRVNLQSLPTSSAGLASGDIYSNAGVLTIVP